MSCTKSSLDRSIWTILCGAMLILISGCKEDTKDYTQYSNPIEAAYFEDYDSPTYKWGYIDTDGHKVIKAKWDDLKEMQATLTAANYKGRWGYIDTEGKTKIDYSYKQATRFCDQRAFVRDFHNKWLLINESGEVLDTTEFTQVNVFEHGHCVVDKLGLKGAIDKSGQLVVPLSYSGLTIIGENKFIAKKARSYAVLDGQEPLTGFDYDKIYVPNEQLMRFKKNKLYGYLNINGKEVASARYDKASNFESGVAVVKEAGQYKLINKRFQIIKSLVADKVEFADEGKWMYKQSGKWGLLDNRGEVIMEPRYDLMNRYNSNRIAVAVDDKWGYCDENGKEVITVKFPLVWDFFDGRARIIDDRGVGFIDVDGVMVIPDNFIEVRDFSNGLARFQSYR